MQNISLIPMSEIMSRIQGIPDQFKDALAAKVNSKLILPHRDNKELRFLLHLQGRNFLMLYSPENITVTLEDTRPADIEQAGKLRNIIKDFDLMVLVHDT